MKEIILQFIEQIEQDQKFSTNTKIAYRSDLTEFLEYVERTNTKINTINHIWVKNYIKHLGETNKERNSFNRRASTFRLFLRFLYKNKLAPTNYSLIVNNLSVFYKNYDDVLKKEDIKKIIEETKLKDGQRLILFLIGRLGLSATQIAEIKTYEIDFENKIINMSDTEKIYLPNEIFILLRDYVIKTRAAHQTHNDNLSLFLNEKGEAISETDIYKLIKKLSGDLKLEGKLNTRTLKNSFENKIDVLSVQRQVLSITARNKSNEAVL